MTSSIIVELSNFPDFVEHNMSYQSSKFQISGMFGSNFTEGSGKQSPPVLCREKKLSAFRVKGRYSINNTKL